MQYKRIAIDTAKNVFSTHGIDEHDKVSLPLSTRS